MIQEIIDKPYTYEYITSMNNRIKSIDSYNENIKYKNVDEHQMNTAIKKGKYIKLLLEKISNDKTNESFKFYMSYKINENDLINKYIFNVRIVSNYYGEMLNTSFNFRIPYFGWDVFEHIIRDFVKLNYDAIDYMKYNNNYQFNIINTNKVSIETQIPPRYLKLTNEIYKAKKQKMKSYKIRR